MSCILYSKGAYLHLQRNSRLANDLAATIFQQPLAGFLFDLNADAYAVRYGYDENAAEIQQAREDINGSDYEFELTDWNDPTQLRDLLKRIEYQCSDILTTTSQVDAIADKYQSGNFNGMVDSYDYDRSAYGAAVATVLGRSQYVSSSRSLSARFLRDVTINVCFEYHHDDLPLVKGDEKSAYVTGGNVPYCNGAYQSLQEVIHRTAHETSCC